jgi:hypothetical protein
MATKSTETNGKGKRFHFLFHRRNNKSRDKLPAVTNENFIPIERLVQHQNEITLENLPALEVMTSQEIHREIVLRFRLMQRDGLMECLDPKALEEFFVIPKQKEHFEVVTKIRPPRQKFTPVILMGNKSRFHGRGK